MGEAGEAYVELIEKARTLVQDFAGGEINPEFYRGVVELVCRMSGLEAASAHTLFVEYALGLRP